MVNTICVCVDLLQLLQLLSYIQGIKLFVCLFVLNEKPSLGGLQKRRKKSEKPSTHTVCLSVKKRWGTSRVGAHYPYQSPFVGLRECKQELHTQRVRLEKQKQLRIATWNARARGSA